MKEPIRILHLEDDPADRELTRANLDAAGLTYRITGVQTGAEYEQALRQGGYDVILADFKLPMYDGMSALRLVQDLCPDVPFIFVSGTMGEDAAIEGLTKGATDYVLKQKLSRLVPAIKRALTEAENKRERKQAEERLKETLGRLRKAIEATVQVMVSAIETRDPYTAGHQLRSADLARSIAIELGLDQERIEGIRMAGIIHDIGKLSIPSEILSKPTKLTDLEFSLIKEHSRIGYEILKNIESPWPLADIVCQHHERINGSGYPAHLKMDETLLESRILAVADVVEAMASHRPYRASLGIESALKEIEQNKGILYDADVVDACLKLFREKDYQLIKEEHFPLDE